MGAGSGELTLEMGRMFPATRPVVYEAFTDPDVLMKWWGPEGFTIPSLDYDPRIGAAYRIEMKPPGADSFYLRGEFQKVDPPERLVYSFAWEEPDPDDVENVVALSFHDRVGSTMVLLDHAPFKTEARRELLRGGWTESFNKLQALLAQR